MSAMNVFNNIGADKLLPNKQIGRMEKECRWKGEVGQVNSTRGFDGKKKCAARTLAHSYLKVQ